MINILFYLAHHELNIIKKKNEEIKDWYQIELTHDPEYLYFRHSADWSKLDKKYSAFPTHLPVGFIYDQIFLINRETWCIFALPNWEQIKTLMGGKKNFLVKHINLQLDKYLCSSRIKDSANVKPNDKCTVTGGQPNLKVPENRPDIVEMTVTAEKNAYSFFYFILSVLGLGGCYVAYSKFFSDPDNAMSMNLKTSNMGQLFQTASTKCGTLFNRLPGLTGTIAQAASDHSTSTKSTLPTSNSFSKTKI